MDTIVLAFQIVDGVRAVIAALKGEARIVLTCRQLLHSTQLYAECLQSVQDVWNDSTKTSSSAEVKKSLTRISTLVANDIDLLQKIKTEVDEIFKSHNSKGLLQNVMISKWNGRIDRIHRMESELMNRFQVITSIMVKDIFKSNNCLDEATMEMIGDVDGSVFWHSNFGTKKTTTFQLFADAYQDYISKTLFFRRLPRMHLLTLLKATILSNALIPAADLSNTEVSVTQFAQWLHRFGPMRETLSKASAVSIPSQEQVVPWFQKDMNRDQAMALLEHNSRRFGSNILPQHLIVLRYSSDVKNHFVITCRHLGSAKVEHFPIVNAAQGYCITGDEEHAYPTLVELMQGAIIDRLYAPALGGSYTFPRDSLDEWEAIFSQATAPLPEGHYGNRNALEKAVMEMTNTPTASGRNEQSGGEGSISYGFATLFTSSGVKVPLPSPPPPLPGGANPSSGMTGMVNEPKIIGRYLIKQGIEMLSQSGEVSLSDLNALRALLDRL